MTNSQPTNDDDATACDAIRILAHACLYPELTVDIGSEAPDTTPNAPFRAQLSERLHRLFDALHQFGQKPEASGECLALATRVQLTLLYCEQTAKYADFGVSEAELKQSIAALRPRIEGWLCADRTPDAPQLNAGVLAWYKERVTVVRWRRQAGATVGLARYAVLCYPSDSARLCRDDALFLLSAATLTAEHFEHTHKELALDVFLVILRNLHPTELHATNIAEPIYQFALHQTHIIKNLHVNRLLWHCLQLCVQHKTAGPPLAPSQWNCRDDVCSALLTRLAFENDSHVRQFLLQCIPRVFASPVADALASDADLLAADVDRLRQQCLAAGICLTACRWVKKLVKILPYHVSCCFGPATDVAHNLRIVHVAYLVTLFAMPVRLCAAQLRELLDELPTHLVQLVRHDGAAALRTEVSLLLQSLLEQIRPAASGGRELEGLSAEWQAYFAGRRETLEVLRTHLGT